MNATEMAAAKELAAPGSNAEAYAIYLTGLYEADRDAGFQNEPESVETIDGGFAICSTPVSDDRPCTEFTNIQHKGDKIADFDAGGEPLAGRLVLGDGQAQPLGNMAEITLIASYRSAAGNVIVVTEISSNVDDFFPSASYRAPDGRQSDTTMISGASMLQAGSRSYYAYMFEGAEFGGELLFTNYDPNTLEDVKLTLATAPNQ